MSAEHTLALLILVWCAGFLLGDWIRFRREQRLSNRRVDGLRRWYIGSLRDW